jgi:hypothetical protein
VTFAEMDTTPDPDIQQHPLFSSVSNEVIDLTVFFVIFVSLTINILTPLTNNF